MHGKGVWVSLLSGVEQTQSVVVVSGLEQTQCACQCSMLLLHYPCAQ